VQLLEKARRNIATKEAVLKNKKGRAGQDHPLLLKRKKAF